MVSSIVAVGRFLRGRVVAFFWEKAARRSLARSRYSSALVSWTKVQASPAFDILAVALETRSAFWRLSRWSWLRRSCLCSSGSVLNWREQR